MLEYVPLSSKCICSKNEHHWIYLKRFIIIVLIEVEIIYFTWSSDEVHKMMAFFPAGLCAISGWWSCNGMDGCGMHMFIQWYIYIYICLSLSYIIYIYTIYTHIYVYYIYIYIIIMHPLIQLVAPGWLDYLNQQQWFISRERERELVGMIS